MYHAEPRTIDRPSYTFFTFESVSLRNVVYIVWAENVCGVTSLSTGLNREQLSPLSAVR
jgi:hypothetical protein